MTYLLSNHALVDDLCQQKKLEDFAIKDEEIAYHVQDILDEYDFVGIHERLHESLVAMSMLTGMNINDVIFNYRPIKNARCGSLEEPSWLNDGMRFYLKSAGKLSFSLLFLFSHMLMQLNFLTYVTHCV